MKICFPVSQDNGLESKVFNHFGSAPMFVVVDTDSMDVSRITNNDAHHAHGACNPIKALDGQAVDAIVVGGIGGGALNKLNQSGLRVYRTMGATVAEDVEMFAKGLLGEFTSLQTCSGHSHSGGCSH
ncbi:MAG: NifB/NifX family molybdenum-iron cluster-binding protein [Thermodesulfovibrionales bacterium]|jgi:predicted Fe-Mo cluster-binding NifX family protein